MTDFLDLVTHAAASSGAPAVWGPFDFGTYAGNSATFRTAWSANGTGVWDLDATHTDTSTGAIPRANLVTAGSIGINPTIHYTATGLTPRHWYQVRYDSGEDYGAGFTGWNPGTWVTAPLVQADASGNVTVSVTLTIGSGGLSPLGHAWVDNVRLTDTTSTVVAVPCAIGKCAMTTEEVADRERAFDGTQRKTTGGTPKRVWSVETVPLTASQRTTLKSALPTSLTSASGTWLNGSTVAVWPSEAKEAAIPIGSGPETSLTFTLTEA